MNFNLLSYYLKLFYIIPTITTSYGIHKIEITLKLNYPDLYLYKQAMEK